MNRSVFLLSSLLACSSALPALAASRVSLFATLPDPVWKAPTGGSSPLVRDAAGNFYGIGSSFGTYGGPIFYKLSPSGEFSVVHAFEQGDITPLTADGEGGYVAILTPPSGNPYIFRVGTDGAYEVKAVLGPQDIYAPAQLALTRASDGSFYGVHGNRSGGAPATIFRMTAAGVVTTVATFDSLHSSGPSNALAEGPDGALYGVAAASAPNRTDSTSIFRMSRDGAITIIYDMPGRGYPENAPLAVAADGTLYGAFDWLSTDISKGYFHVGIDGSGWAIQKSSGLLSAPVTGADGKVYSIVRTVDGLGNPVSAALVRVNADASTTVIGTTSDPVGASTYQPLFPLPDGGFAGVSPSGGAFYEGGVFQWSPAGKYSTLAEFVGGSDFPRLSPLTFAADGSAYGCRSFGAAGGRGEIFHLSAQGEYSTMGTLPDSSPISVALAKDGNLYGISVPVAAGDRSTLFRMTPAGKVTTLKVFTDSKPITFFLASNGEFYGTAIAQGQPYPNQVFHATIGGAFGILRTFALSTEGSVVLLTYRNDGYLWGTCNLGLSTTLFRMNAHAAADGGFVPWFTMTDTPSQLITTQDGEIYGIYSGSTRTPAYLFQFRPEVKATKTTTPLTHIHDFGPNDVHAPDEILMGQAGRLYGVYFGGGEFSRGIVYSMAKDGSDLHSHYHFDDSASNPQHLALGPDGDIFLDTPRKNFSPDDLFPNHDRYFRVHVDNGPSALDLWLQAQGLSGGADGDDDHDGLSNEMEFALGTDPHQAATAPAGFVQGTAIAGPPDLKAGATVTDFASLTYSVGQEAREAGLRVIPETSYDLKQWDSGYYWNPFPLGQNDHLSILQYQQRPSDSGQIYFRLRVETP